MANTITNVDLAIRGMRRIAQGDIMAIDEGVEKAAYIVARKADYYCPKKTLALVDSRRIRVTGKGSGARAVISYGGKNAPYAVWVHENLTARHTDPTCAKWLERAARESRGTITAMMKRQISTEATKRVGRRLMRED